MKSEDVRLSKFLAFILRHEPESVGLELDQSGWVSVDELLNACNKHGHPLTIERLSKIVFENDKSRFAFSEDGRSIRASQGHSIGVELGYEPKQPPQILYHGTASRFLDSIRQQGLLKRERHHVHMTASQEVALSVGQRYGTAVLLTIEAARMNEDGHQFFVSANGVWLTDAVPVQYISFNESDCSG